MSPPPPTAAATACGNCCSDDRWILHNVQIGGLYRKLCTSCVLKLHPTSFCPTCFNLHDPLTTTTTTSSSSSSSNNRTLTCLKCSSISHITCVPRNTPKSPYLCPPCSNPSFKFFNFRKPTKNHHDPDPQSDGGDDGSEKKLPEDSQVIDEAAAKVLLAAAKIAAMSMNRAAAAKRMEAEKRVRESALARKRVKEAIDHVIFLSSELKNAKRKDDLPVKLEKDGGTHNVGPAVAASNNHGGGGGKEGVGQQCK